MLLAGSTRFLFLGFCTGGAGATNPHAARTKSTLGRHNSGSHFSRVAVQAAGHTKTVGWVGVWSWTALRGRCQGRGARGSALHGARCADPFPVALFGLSLAQLRTQGTHTRTARRGLHQSCPMGARLRGTPAAAPARSWRGKGRTQTPHRPLQLGSCYSTAAHRVAARTSLTTPAQGWVFTPSAHCFTQATFKP